MGFAGSADRGPKRLHSVGAVRMSWVRCTGRGIVGSRCQVGEGLAAPFFQLESPECPWSWGDSLAG
eukprot:8435588-Prorocentrum_lima.AAC.1